MSSYGIPDTEPTKRDKKDVLMQTNIDYDTESEWPLYVVKYIGEDGLAGVTKDNRFVVFTSRWLKNETILGHRDWNYECTAERNATAMLLQEATHFQSKRLRPERWQIIEVGYLKDGNVIPRYAKPNIVVDDEEESDA